MDERTGWTRRAFLATAGASLAFTLIPQAAHAARHGDPYPGFADPPMPARPRIWWFWGESVTTDEGITRDLQAYRQAGFGGVVLYEQVFKAAPDSLASLSPEWLARVRFAAAECARLGLALEVNASNGYVAGGPWITPALGMQRLVASETHVTGDARRVLKLRQPETNLDYYRDVACLAYRTVDGGAPLPLPTITSNATDIDFDAMMARPPVAGEADAGRRKARIRPRADGQPVLVAFDYGHAVTVRSLTFTQRKNSKAPVIATQVPGRWGPDALGQGMRRNPPLGMLEASTDGQRWAAVAELPAMGYQHGWWDRLTVSFAAVTARHFRLNLHGWGRNVPAGDDDLLLGGLTLRGSARVDRWESKAGNLADFADPDRTPRYSHGEVVDPTTVVDVTAHLAPDGSLDWTPPPGDWTILRLGHTPTGARTKHGYPGALGLECDKLSAHATGVQFEHYIGPILAAVRTVPGGRIEGIGIDSAEHGSQNWTTDFPAQFRKRRGYDLLPWLPAMMGIPVASAEATDRVLFDVRRTIADLMSDEYFGTFTRLANAAGMTVTAQAPGIATCLPGDNIGAKGRVDIPMGEFWVNQFGGEGQPEGTMDCREAASAAHLYGKPIVAAEAFTGSPAHIHPAMLKPFADAAFANGINRMVVLAGNHQPYGDRRKPGVTEDKFFLPYQRNNTWWKQSTPFWHTLGRASYLLGLGRPVVDLLYHLGSDTPLKIATARMRPAPPAGHDWDVCGDEELLRATIDDGCLVMPGGMRYPVLVLAGGEAMTLAAARHVLHLVRHGARVIGPVRARRTPGFADAAGQPELLRIADELWGVAPQPARGERRVGAGVVMWGEEPAVHLARLGIGTDFHAAGLDPLDILFVHRKVDGMDLYFVANHRPGPLAVDALFRDGAGAPQAWDPGTGQRCTLPGARATPRGTTVPLRLEQHASLFVVFGAPAAPAAAAGPLSLIGELPVRHTLRGPWRVAFDPAWGGPASLVLPELACWTAHALESVRHYSGTAIYRTQFDLPRLPRDAVWLDLGQVEVVATVSVNGTEVTTLWKAPYAADIGRHLRKGRNRLEVRVANLWANRLIADAGLPPEQRIAWATFNPYQPGDVLFPSGLLGPVTLRYDGAG
ncbi:glycosyl hydrolase [Pseudoduganella lutea]|uniref:Glycosyl hydrolase family 2 n=1 Tax=Pseudoduganella lutea TaxID=321985 RepID=A0A4P6KTT0_9BURK|nr:glycosyl hydrolase [Pseudoduganella lutea]QBE62187.1 glycosyl hydrolase family 2 [Pseudoduganella lutea]